MIPGSVLKEEDTPVMITHQSSPSIRATFLWFQSDQYVFVKVVDISLDKYDQESNKDKTCLVEIYRLCYTAPLA